MRLSVDVFGDVLVADRLRRVSQRLEYARPFFERVGRLILEANKQHFRSASWTPLDPDTVRQKARKGQSRGILRATGRLERALTVWGAPGQKMRIDHDSVTVGIDPLGEAKYGLFHQEGRSVPKRPLVNPNRLQIARVHQALQDHIFGGL